MTSKTNSYYSISSYWLLLFFFFFLLLLLIITIIIITKAYIKVTPSRKLQGSSTKNVQTV